MHPKFKLNGEHFDTDDALRRHANILVENDKNDERAIGKFILEWLDANSFITVKTSGSTGVPKQIKLEKKNVLNSAQASIDYFDLPQETKVLLCLPSQYIAGKMMLVRAMVAGWDLHTVPPKKKPLEHLENDFDFTAMVPYQVFHSLKKLHKVKKLIIGGGAVSRPLEKQLEQFPTKVFATYGMTETISHIAVRPLNGLEKSNIFTALPNVNFSLSHDGRLQIHAPEISDETVITNDVVELFSSTSFKFVGRMDNIINTGGIKVHPEMVEEKLYPQMDKPFFIASEMDRALGERVILIVESNNDESLDNFSEAFKNLSIYEKPRMLYVVPKFKYTDTGKIKRVEVLKSL